MSTQTELTQEQKAWVVRVTHVLGSTTPGSTLSTEGKLSLGEIKVSLHDADQSLTDKARRERARALIVPREHGAWGLLLVPMVTGAGIALRQSSNRLPFYSSADDRSRPLLASHSAREPPRYFSSACRDQRRTPVHDVCCLLFRRGGGSLIKHVALGRP